MNNYFRKHPWSLGAVAVIVAGLAWLAFGFFGVQTLFLDKEVSEAPPSFDAAPVAEPEANNSTPADGGSLEIPAAAPTTLQASAPVDQAEPAVLPTQPPGVPAAPAIVTEYSGSFEPGAHPTSGTAVVLGNGTDQRFLRFEEFSTDNGPDLNVYLVNSSTGNVSDFVDLGDLKGNIGEQNYEIPAGVDLSVYDEVVIWCVRFGVGFGNAILAAV